MSYYGSSSYNSASLLDPYCAGGSRYHSSGLSDSIFDRKDNYYSSTYSSAYGGLSNNDYASSRPSARPSAFDRYVSYLSDEMTSSSSSAANRSPRNTYSSNIGSTSSNYDDDFKLPALTSTSYRRLNSDSYSNNLRGTSVVSSIGRPLITSVPAYDKYGKELSNYERWKMQQSEAAAGYSSSSSSDSRPLRTRLGLNDETSATATSRADRESTTIPISPTIRQEKEISPVFTSRYNSSSSTASGGKSISYETSSYSRPTSIRTTHSFPSSVRSKLSDYDVQDVRGDGGCYYRCLSLYFTGSEESYNKYRREVMNYIKENLDSYSSMIKSEVGYASTNDYFSRKLRTDHQEFAETTEIIATCCLYDINIHVLALVPGRHTWEWLHFDPSIGSGKPSYTSRDIYLYNQGSVHFMLCSPK